MSPTAIIVIVESTTTVTYDEFFLSSEVCVFLVLSKHDTTKDIRRIKVKILDFIIGEKI
ncbi:hypothetical protein MASR1M45_30980 [Candidatus Kapaibacterium sp.]